MQTKNHRLNSYVRAIAASAVVASATAAPLEARVNTVNAYSTDIKSALNYYHDRLGILIPENWIKAMILVESGGHGQAFRKDPMQIANRGDFALSVLAHGGEYAKLIGNFSFLEGKHHTPFVHGHWNYSHSNMTGYDSIRGGIGWLIDKMIISAKPAHSGPESEHVYNVRKGDTLSGIAHIIHTPLSLLRRENHIKNPNMIYPGEKIIYYERARAGVVLRTRSLQEATRLYNGGGDPDYLAKVKHEYYAINKAQAAKR